MKAQLFSVVLLTLTAAAHAQFGSIVIDPTQSAHAATQIVQSSQLYTSAISTEQNVIGAYNLAKQMAALPKTYMTTYSNAGQQAWTPVAAPANTYGNTAAWNSSINNGRGAAQANQAISIPRTGQIEGYEKMSAQGRQAAAAQGATIDLGDTANITTLQTLGAVRAAAPQYEADIQRLEAATHSTNPADQTQSAQLQRINQALLLQLRAQQSIMQMQQAQAMQQLVQAKGEQDGLKQSVLTTQGYQQSVAAHMGTPTPTTSSPSTSH